MSKFENSLNNVLEGLESPSYVDTQAENTKTASVTSTRSSEGLRKLASILRQTKVDPTYQDLYSFVERVRR